MDGFGIAHQIVNLVGEAKHLVIIGAHTLSHNFIINADHMTMARVQLIRQEWQQRKAEGDFSRLGSGDIKADRWSSVDNILAQFL